MTDPSEDFDNVAWDVQGDQQASSSFDYHGTDGPAVIDPLSDMNDSFMHTLDLSTDDQQTSNNNLDINSPHYNTAKQQQEDTQKDPLTISSIDAALSTPISTHPKEETVPSTNNRSATSSSSPPLTSSSTSTTAIKVTDPRKENDGQQGIFVSYAIVSKNATVRRRFQDFVWLFNVLYTNYPACIVPPLPDKHRLEYVKGDRFGTDFVEKRRVSMERFLQRITRHPILHRASFFTTFLESSDFNDASERALREGQETMIDTIGDSLLNAFVKIRKPEQQFVDMRERVDRLEDNFNTLEKTLTRTNKRTDDLSHDYKELAVSIQGLAQLETTFQPHLDVFAQATLAYAGNMTIMTTFDTDWLSEIHDYMSYHNSMKDVLKLRDQKQLDFEELTDYLQSTLKEREKAMYPSRSDTGGIGGGGGGGGGFTGYLASKLNEVRGADAEKIRRERILRLDDRIRELQEAVEQTHEVSDAFSDQVKKESEFFVRNNAIEMHGALQNYTNAKVDFYQKGVDTWRHVVETLEAQEQSMQTD